MVNTSGNVTAEQRYLHFGETRLTATLPTDRLYTWQRVLPGLGLYQFGARAYLPLIGRFVSADAMVPEPIYPPAYNRYSYVYNNPIKYSDPTGHSPCEDPYWPTAFEQAHGYAPSGADYVDCKFADRFPGSGPSGTWTEWNWVVAAGISTEEKLWWLTQVGSLPNLGDQLRITALSLESQTEIHGERVDYFEWGIHLEEGVRAIFFVSASISYQLDFTHRPCSRRVTQG